MIISSIVVVVVGVASFVAGVLVGRANKKVVGQVVANTKAVEARVVTDAKTVVADTQATVKKL